MYIWQKLYRVVYFLFYIHIVDRKPIFCWLVNAGEILRQYLCLHSVYVFIATKFLLFLLELLGIMSVSGFLRHSVYTKIMTVF